MYVVKTKSGTADIVSKLLITNLAFQCFFIPDTTHAYTQYHKKNIHTHTHYLTHIICVCVSLFIRNIYARITIIEGKGKKKYLRKRILTN